MNDIKNDIQIIVSTTNNVNKFNDDITEFSSNINSDVEIIYVM